MGRFDFEGYARGWFVVGFSTELAPGDVKPLHYFDSHMVMFRTGSGDVRILDAHCPHMGAHLGIGGVVSGDSVRCPFHAWEFDGSGACSHIPYASKIPPRAKVKAWPVRERNGMIYVWHGRDGAEPDWEIPVLEGHGTDAWTEWSTGDLEIIGHPREIVENVVDIGHFIPVHGTHIDTISNVFEGHTAAQINSGTAYPVGGGKDDYDLTATYYGPAYQVTSMRGVLHSRLINAHTPISGRKVHLRFAVSLRRVPNSKYDARDFVEQYVENLRLGFFQDIRIWEHLKFRDPPIVCDGDGPIIKLRRWYSQFYEPVGV